MLIDLIIEKAVSQTKYAACFADLSAKLAKINNSEYKYKVESKKKKSFFRVIFYEKV